MSIALLNLIIFFHLLFLLAIKIKDNSIVDIGWGVGFIIIDLSLLANTHIYNEVQMLVSALILLWAVRLSTYIYLRKGCAPEDFRYAAWRVQWGNSVIWRSYLQIFLLQMCILILIAIPMFLIFNKNHIFTYVNAIGLIIALLGLTIETISDWQMFSFKKNPKNYGLIMKYGLWKYSRHPNYFGEALFWWGIAFTIYSKDNYYLAFISPILITILVRYVSGVPMLEAKYAHNAEYIKYRNTTSSFIPWFLKK